MSYYIAVIECPDGTTYEQRFYDFYELLDLKKMLGAEYLIVSIY